MSQQIDLSNEAIQKRIGSWMSYLFDNNLHLDQVKEAVSIVTNRLTSKKMKREIVDDNGLTFILKSVENEMFMKKSKEVFK